MRACAKFAHCHVQGTALIILYFYTSMEWLESGDLNEIEVICIKLCNKFKFVYVIQAGIRNQYFDFMAENGLTRILDCQRCQEYSLMKGQRIFHFANASTFSRSPELVLLCFVSDERHTGVNMPRNIFTHFGLEDLSVYRNGQPMVTNEFTRGMQLYDINSPHVDFFYRKLINFFRPTAEKSISRERFHSSFFLIPIEVAAIPRFLFPEDTSNTVNLIQAVNLDLDLNFSQALEVPIQMFLISFDKVVLKIGPSGDIIEG